MKKRWIQAQIEAAKTLDVVFPWERGARNSRRHRAPLPMRANA